MTAVAVVDGHSIGDGGVFVLAEAGVNHNGDVDLAHRLIDVAADCGADAVKFQTFDAERVVSQRAAAAPYQQRNGGPASQLDLLRSLVLPHSAWTELQQHTRERGLTFLSTPFDVASAHLLAEIGVPAVKIGSGELTNVPFLHDVASLGLPVLLSTGMATLAEVEQAMTATAAAPSRALFHCVSAYPAPIEQANLRAMATMRDAFNVPVGWSDHTTDATSSIAAVALGAALIEKHFTLDPTMPGPDHKASLDPDTFAAFVAALRATVTALGSGVKERAPIENENAALVRRSWHTAGAVRAGAVLGADDVEVLRPEGGLAPADSPVGRRVVRDLEAGVPITAADVE